MFRNRIGDIFKSNKKINSKKNLKNDSVRTFIKCMYVNEITGEEIDLLLDSNPFWNNNIKKQWHFRINYSKRRKLKGNWGIFWFYIYFFYGIYLERFFHFNAALLLLALHFISSQYTRIYAAYIYRTKIPTNIFKTKIKTRKSFNFIDKFTFFCFFFRKNFYFSMHLCVWLCRNT